MSSILVATESAVMAFDIEHGGASTGSGLDDRPTCLAADPLSGWVWCGTHKRGVFRSDDGGATWKAMGLASLQIMSVTASPVQRDLVWVGTEPSEVWRSSNAGATWEQTHDLETLPSSPEWSFPPKPETHHVRWIACHPSDANRLWVAIEAGALVSTMDGGRSWRDRVNEGPWDTHELAIHHDKPNTLRVAAGDGYFESGDGGATWRSPEDGLEVGYLRSVTVAAGNADIVIVSASTGPRSAYVAGVSDGRLYRRTGSGPWVRVTSGWPNPANTIAPLLAAGTAPGELWAADERGIHRSDDTGETWRMVAKYPTPANHIRGVAILQG